MVVPSPSPKAETRRKALEARRAYARSLAPELRADLEAKLADIVLPRLIGARIVERLAPGQRAALPWFQERDSRMIFREAPASEPSPWGVLQPPGAAEALAPDTVLVPLVAADRKGTRIGHGKGHYDRALAHLREGEGGTVFTIGLAWESQILDELLEPDPWDVPLDAIATPKEWIDCR
jgi:5-formyltetrahydrofolate cyclo-ligase